MIMIILILVTTLVDNVECWMGGRMDDGRWVVGGEWWAPTRRQSPLEIFPKHSNLLLKGKKRKISHFCLTISSHAFQNDKDIG